jgi:hypothetical protein
MADFLAPRQGGRYIGTAALPATVWFDLSTKSVDSTNPFTHASTTATRGALTHAGFSTYNSMSKARPTGASSLGGTFVFGTITWSNGAVAWPSGRSWRPRVRLRAPCLPVGTCRSVVELVT